MERRVAKEVLHLEDWLARAADLVSRGEEAYRSDALLQEAGDALMMKLGGAANRLARLGVAPPAEVDWALAVANRNFLIHQYDAIDRRLTWATLTVDLPAWRASLGPLITQARRALGTDRDSG